MFNNKFLDLHGRDNHILTPIANPSLFPHCLSQINHLLDLYGQINNTPPDICRESLINPILHNGIIHLCNPQCGLKTGSALQDQSICLSGPLPSLNHHYKLHFNYPRTPSDLVLRMKHISWFKTSTKSE